MLAREWAVGPHRNDTPLYDAALEVMGVNEAGEVVRATVLVGPGLPERAGDFDPTVVGLVRQAQAVGEQALVASWGGVVI